MTEHYIKISTQNLSLPENCFSSDIVAAIYLIIPRIATPQIFDIKCRNSGQCPTKNCQYKNIVPFKN